MKCAAYGPFPAEFLCVLLAVSSTTCTSPQFGYTPLCSLPIDVATLCPSCLGDFLSRPYSAAYP